MHQNSVAFLLFVALKVFVIYQIRIHSRARRKFRTENVAIFICVARSKMCVFNAIIINFRSCCLNIFHIHYTEVTFLCIVGPLFSMFHIFSSILLSYSHPIDRPSNHSKYYRYRKCSLVKHDFQSRTINQKFAATHSSMNSFNCRLSF